MNLELRRRLDDVLHPAGSDTPGNCTRISLSPRPYCSITGSLTPSVSTRSRIVSIDVSSVRYSRSRIADSFIVIVICRCGVDDTS